MAGTDNESDDASVYSQAINAQQQPNIQPQIITNISNNNTKFPYLKKDEYEESKARTTMLQSIPDDHVADFHYIDDDRDIWNAVNARFGGNAESKKMRKFMLKQEFSEFRIGEAKGLHKGPSHFTFVSATSASKKMSYGDSPSYSSNTTYFAPSNSKTGSHRSGNVLEDVIQSFVADTEPEQQLAYKDFEQIEKLDLEEIDLKWQMAMLSVRVHKFEQKARRKIDFDKKESARFNKKKRYSSFKIKEIGKKEEVSKALITVDTLVDWIDHDDESDEVIAAKEFGMIAGCDSEDAIKEGAAKIYNLIIGANSEETNTIVDVGEFALMGVTSKVHTCPFGCDNKYNELHKEYTELNEQNGECFIQVQAYNNSLKTLEKQKRVLQRKQLTLEDKIRRNSSKNLFRLIDSSMSVRTKVGLGFNDCIRENELGYDGSAFSVFTTNFKDVEGRPLFHSDKSLEVNTNDFASSDSSVKSLKHKPNDSTSCASTSSESTSVNEAEIESNVRTPTQEPIIVQDLPSFSCNSFDKNEHTSRTSCNKNSYFNKKAGHFRKNASSVSKLCFVCGSGTHLIKDCDFYEKQMANKTVGIGVGPVHSRNKVNHQNQFVSQAVLLKTGKVNIPSSRPQSVPTGKPKVFAPVPTGRPNKPFPVPNDRGYSPSENPFSAAEDEGIFDSGCSRSMTSNKERMDDFQDFQGGKVTFRGGEGRITGKGTIRTPTLDFENVYYVKELQQFNLFSISQICDKKNQVLFTNTECLVLSKDFTVLDDSKQHKAFYTAINVVSSISEPLQLLHMDLFGPTSIRSIDHKYFCLVITDDYSSHLKPFGCHVTILNTSDRLGKFDGKADEGYIIGYSASNKAYMVYNVPNKSVEEFMNMRFLEEKPNVQGLSHEWYFDLDYLTDSLGYKHIQANQSTGTQGATTNSADTSGDEVDDSRFHSANEIFQKELAWLKGQEQRVTSDAESLGLGFANNAEELQTQTSAKTVPPGCIPVPTGNVPIPTGSLPVLTGSIPVPTDATMVSSDDVPVHTSSLNDSTFDDEPTTRFSYLSDLRNHDPSPGIFSSSSYDDEFGAALNNVASTVEVSLVATKRINNIHPKSMIIVDPTSAVQMRSKVKQTTTGDSAFISYVFDQQRDNHTDFHHCLFACFLSQVEPRSVAQALEDPSWVDAMQKEMKQFKFQNVWVLVDFSEGKYAIRTKWILKNKRDARGVVVRNKAKLVAQGHRQEEGIDYDEVFAPIARIEAIRLFLSFASYMGFRVYQMDVKSVFFYERINEEAWCDEFEALMKGEFEISAMGELTFFLGLQVQQRPDGIFINQDKYVQEILNKFYLGSVRTATTPYEAPKPKSKNESDISACSRNQVTLITSNLEAVKKIFKYLKGQPKRLISWQCKKQTIMATSSTEAEYVATANCCGQVILPSIILYMFCVYWPHLLQPNGSRRASVPSGVSRVPTGSFVPTG
nr:copia protein [Tanacetum cinerariifolium]